MQVKDLMSKSPACCNPGTPLQEVAKTMIQNDCGCLPVVESDMRPILVGVITDRDIVCRAVAANKNTEFLRAQDCMSKEVITANPEMDMDTCCHLMEHNQVRRLPVVDGAGLCRGIVSQADIAQACDPEITAEVVRDISRHTEGSRPVFA